MNIQKLIESLNVQIEAQEEAIFKNIDFRYMTIYDNKILLSVDQAKLFLELLEKQIESDKINEYNKKQLSEKEYKQLMKVLYPKQKKRKVRTA